MVYCYERGVGIPLVELVEAKAVIDVVKVNECIRHSVESFVSQEQLQIKEGFPRFQTQDLGSEIKLLC